ncbi:MAG: acyl-CoA dehydrogenase, partial [Verrucomicrobiae bacterium]|nr:acyl-CoA dehydrogenase [Verrucomicrobiae bacterium]
CIRDSFHKTRQGVTFALADALCWILAARQFILDVTELRIKGSENPALAESLPGLVSFFTDLANVQAARAAGEVGRIAAELVYGYRCDLGTRAGRDACYSESTSPESAPNAHIHSAAADSESADLALFPTELQQFAKLRMKLDICLAGSRLAKDRAAQALTTVMVPEALDYPA